MKKAVILLVGLLAFLSLEAAQAAKSKCRCARQPFKPDPPCVKLCVTGLLAIASRDDLMTLFGLDSGTVAAVVHAQEKLSSLDQNIADLLTDAQNHAITVALARVSDESLHDFVERRTAETLSSKSFLHEMMASLDAEPTTIKVNDSNKTLEKYPKSLQEALRRAMEAGKVASGKFLFEATLRDSSVKFGFNASEMSPETQVALDEFAEELKMANSSVYIEIQGHTDNVGSEKYNKELGLQRAEAVRRYLNEKHGIPLDRLGVVSYGSTAAVADNSTREGRAQNRRIELIVLQ